MCPALRRTDHLGARVGRSTVVGVYGALYQAANPHPIAISDITMAFDNPLIRWVQAAQMVREITDCTIVDLDDL
jgi:hypothetical protein